jgi:hypothetical protein
VVDLVVDLEVVRAVAAGLRGVASEVLAGRTPDRLVVAAAAAPGGRLSAAADDARSGWAGAVRDACDGLVDAADVLTDAAEQLAAVDWALAAGVLIPPGVLR